MDNKMYGLIILILVPLLVPFVYIINGLVLSIMWRWFIVPLGVIAIGKAHAIGIASIVGMVAKNSNQEDNRDVSEKFVAFISVGIVSPFIVLSIGYLMKSLM